MDPRIVCAVFAAWACSSVAGCVEEEPLPGDELLATDEVLLVDDLAASVDPAANTCPTYPGYSCHPIYQYECPQGHGCYPDSTGFSCIPVPSGIVGGQGDPCEYINACNPGLFCANASDVPGCPSWSSGCCTEFTGLGGRCPQGLAAEPWFTPATAPDACYARLAACVGP